MHQELGNVQYEPNVARTLAYSLFTLWISRHFLLAYVTLL